VIFPETRECQHNARLQRITIPVYSPKNSIHIDPSGEETTRVTGETDHGSSGVRLSFATAGLIYRMPIALLQTNAVRLLLLDSLGERGLIS
jgi:hypothetical protein